MGEMFKEARLKIERAKHHIDNLNRVFEDFINKKTYVVFVEHDPNGGDDLLKVRGTETLGDDFALILGDALHNLRTALDYAMNEIEFCTRGRRTTFTKFPVYDTRESLEAAINGGMKEKAPKQVIEFIVDTVQPYEGGCGDAIWKLHQLDIEDKHRLLIANTELTFVRGIHIEDDRGVEHAIDDWLIVPGKIASHRIPGNRNVKVKDQGKPTYRVTFGFELSFGGAPIIPLLRQLVEIVEVLLGELEFEFRMSTLSNSL